MGISVSQYGYESTLGLNVRGIWLFICGRANQKKCSCSAPPLAQISVLQQELFLETKFQRRVAQKAQGISTERKKFLMYAQVHSECAQRGVNIRTKTATYFQPNDTTGMLSFRLHWGHKFVSTTASTFMRAPSSSMQVIGMSIEPVRHGVVGTDLTYKFHGSSSLDRSCPVLGTSMEIHGGDKNMKIVSRKSGVSRALTHVGKLLLKP